MQTAKTDQTRWMLRLICLHLVHMPFCWFCHEAAHFVLHGEAQSRKMFRPLHVILLVFMQTAKADLSLCWAHMPFCWFCHEAAHFVLHGEAQSRKMFRPLHVILLVLASGGSYKNHLTQQGLGRVTTHSCISCLLLLLLFAKITSLDKHATTLFFLLFIYMYRNMYVIRTLALIS